MALHKIEALEPKERDIWDQGESTAWITHTFSQVFQGHIPAWTAMDCLYQTLRLREKPWTRDSCAMLCLGRSFVSTTNSPRILSAPLAHHREGRADSGAAGTTRWSTRVFAIALRTEGPNQPPSQRTAWRPSVSCQTLDALTMGHYGTP